MLITLTARDLDGGIGRTLLNLSRCWIRKGIRVDIVLDNKGAACPYGVPSSVDRYVSWGSHPIRGVPWLAWYLGRRRPDLLVTPVPRHTMWAVRARSFVGASTRILGNIHTDYRVAMSHTPERKRRRRIRVMQRAYHRCDWVVPVSEGAAESFSEVTGYPYTRLHTIRNPAVTTDIASLARQPTGHAWLDSSTCPVILGAGRMDRAKNFTLLIDAFERIRADRELRLVIIGSGKLMNELRQRVAASPWHNDIDLPGHQDNPYAFMRRASMFVLSSSWEGLPTVLIEALSVGTPVVATDCPSGPSEILEGGRFGELVPPGDATALATAMRKTLNHSVSREEMDAAVERYRADRIAEQYLQLVRHEITSSTRVLSNE